MTPRARRACLLAWSVIADDGRVRRQGEALAAAGWSVTAVGFDGARSTPPSWPIWPVRSPPPLTVPRRAFRAGCLVLGGRVPPVAARIHPAMPGLADFYRSASAIAADLYIANDWPMLPIASRAAGNAEGAYIYDSHELATSEYFARKKWRTFNLPYVRAIESRHIHGASAVVTVSDGIAEALQSVYALPARPTVIRNVPAWGEVPVRAVDARRIAVLYHGLIAPGRGLEELIDSVAQWRPEFRLTIRGGDAPTSYAESLHRRAEARGVGRRVDFVRAAAQVDIVAEAAKADIGIFSLPGDTLHNTHALPNKFFEYVMAGLALCVSDLPEMSALVRRHDLGRLIAAYDAAAIAVAVNGFTPADVERYRANARAAARELNWNRESARLVEICERAAAQRH